MGAMCSFPSIDANYKVTFIKNYSTLAFYANNGISGTNGQVEYMVGKQESLQLCFKHVHRYLEYH